MAREVVNIMIGGEAGQGLVTVGDLLLRSLIRSGYYIVVTQDYMSRIRGGHNTFVIRAGGGPIAAPREEVDLLIALNEETVELHKGQMSSEGLTVVDGAADVQADRVLKVPYHELAEGRYTNVAALGVACAILGIDQGMVIHALEKAFGKKHPEAVAKNSEALEKAYQWCAEKAPGRLKLSPPESREKRLAMNGNEAIALGAMAAGVKFCAFYPMTPSTSIALNLAARAETMGLVVEQAEDEIAAVNMVLGASHAGAPSIVTTSGGGFALMTEGVSLAGIMELPVVFAVVQRPGPATGLPTRTEQGDLEFVLHSGHGEFPRAIYAPGNVEQCFHLTRRAFGQAEKYQSPVFILNDQFLADSYRAVLPFDLDKELVVNPGRSHDALAAVVEGTYQRYSLAGSGGVSPRLLPGLSEHLVVADSDEHTEDGHITEDLDVRIRMNDKRLKKQEGLMADAVPPDWYGVDKPDILLVCWGTTLGSVLEAADGLTERGQKTAVLHFSQVWPIVPEPLVEQLGRASRVVAVENNATGQMARLIRRETGFHIQDTVLRYDGLPITPEYIWRALAG